MPSLPERAHPDHLRKQAKDLLRAHRRGDPDALARLARTLPFADDLPKLHDAQSCIAREYGFASWLALTTHVAAAAFAREDRATRVARWLALAYQVEVTGRSVPAKPQLAAALLRESPDLSADIHVACASGDVAAIDAACVDGTAWLDRPSGPLGLPPLFAVAHSRLAALPDFRERLQASARRLLAAGADPNQRIGSRMPPASLAAPDGGTPLSALYGAAGVARDPVLTGLLLGAGADPDDGESLYHSLETLDCTRLLLKHGARIAGSNAVGRALDMPEADALELLLAHGGDANEIAPGAVTVWGTPLLRALGVRVSLRHVQALLAAGADPCARTPDGTSAYKLALQVGLTGAAEALRAAGAEEPLGEDEAFVAACARGDASEARRIQTARPDLPAALSEMQLRVLPDMVAWGDRAAARVMVELGWPIDVPGGDWKASALNLATCAGDAGLVEFLLAHGASRHVKHGHGGDVLDTLSWASINEPTEGGDWAACARLLASGLASVARDPADPERVCVDGRWSRFSEPVAGILLGEEA